MQEQQSETHSPNLSNKVQNGLDIVDYTDLDELIDLAIEYHGSAPEFFGTLHLDKMALRLATAMSRCESFVYRVDGEIIGAIILDKTSTWWSHYQHLTDLFIYVKEEHRSFKVIKALLDAAKQYAIINKMRLELTIFNPDDLGRKEKLFNRLGYATEAMTFTNRD